MYVFVWQWLFSLLLPLGNKRDSSSKKKIDCLFFSSSTSLMENFLLLLLWGGEELLWSKTAASLFLLPDKLTVSSGKILNPTQVFANLKDWNNTKKLEVHTQIKEDLGSLNFWGFFLQISWILPNTSMNFSQSSTHCFSRPLQGRFKVTHLTHWRWMDQESKQFAKAQQRVW